MNARYLLLFLAALTTTSCASYFMRKDCEAMNWFQHGQEVALRGENLENDQVLNQCRKVEANIQEAALDQGFKKGRGIYCTPDGIFAVGKKGEPFSKDMCDGENLKKLQLAHLNGVKEYCQPSNGIPAGATGNTYKNVCPKEMEAAFLVGFNKGRIKYLSAQIESREAQVSELDRKIHDLEIRRSTLSGQMSYVSRQLVQHKSVYNPVTRRYEEVTEEDTSARNQMNSLENDMNSINSQISGLQTQQGQLREESRKLRAEMLTL